MRSTRLLGRFAAAGAAGTSGLALYLRGAKDEYLAISEDSLPHRYQPLEIAAVWREHPRVAISRMVEICAKSAPLGLHLTVDAATASQSEPAEARESRQQTRASELRSLLVSLGPAWIKFGQMLSIRPDLLPPPAVYELQKLCDAVPSYPTVDALRLIEAELGRPPAEVFDELDERSEPIAAASLGQVYKCRLREGGEEVALKVQRPDMIRAVSLDLYLARRYMQAAPWPSARRRHAAVRLLTFQPCRPPRSSQAVEWFKTNILTGLLGAADRTPFDVELLDTFARASYLELDYREEARNQRRFADELAPLLGGKVYVPRCHEEGTRRKVLTTEWIQGEQLARSPPDVIKRLTSVGVDCFLTQVPHPTHLRAASLQWPRLTPPSSLSCTAPSPPHRCPTLLPPSHLKTGPRVEQTGHQLTEQYWSPRTALHGHSQSHKSFLRSCCTWASSTRTRTPAT